MSASPAPRRGRELAGFLVTLLPEPFEEPPDAIEIELHHVLERERQAAAAVLVIEQLEEALPELVRIDRRKQSIYGVLARLPAVFAVGRKKLRSKGSSTS
jgi:hypothetical protein